MARTSTNVGDLDDLLNHPILAELGFSVLRTITKAHVYNGGQNAVVIDREDRVYNVSLVSSSGSDYETRMAKRMTENTVLSGQKIINFSTNRSHKFALSESGVLYCWGSNSDGQLGQSTSVQDLPESTPVILQLLEGHKVIRVACGSNHTVALTDDGKVWTWGYNADAQCAWPASSSPCTPKPLTLEKCSDVASSDHTSAALTTEGTVYTWGDNSKRAVGCFSTASSVSTPYRVNLPLRAIGISMGSHHALTLTEEGKMFAWGRNDYGQVGNNMCGTDISSPVLIECKKGGLPVKLAEVVAIGNTSAAISIAGEVYIWGSFGGSNQSVPRRIEIETRLRTVLTKYGYDTDETLTIQHDDVAHDIERSFDVEELSDCSFKVDGKTIHAQRSTLKSRSQYFQTMLGGAWKESSGTIEITKHSYPVYKAFLKYFYTSKLDLEDKDLLALLQLAHETLHESLLTTCVDKLRFQLSAENILDTYELASQLDVDRLLDYCRKFGKAFMEEIVEAETGRPEMLTKFLAFVFKKNGEGEGQSSQ